MSQVELPVLDWGHDKNSGRVTMQTIQKLESKRAIADPSDRPKPALEILPATVLRFSIGSWWDMATPQMEYEPLLPSGRLPFSFISELPIRRVVLHESTKATSTTLFVDDDGTLATATAAAAVYSKAFGKVFKRRFTPFVEWGDSTDGGYWRLTLRVPNSLLSNVAKLFLLERRAYDELETNYPEFVGYFAVQYKLSK